MALPARPLQIAGTLARARVGIRTPLKVTHLLTYRCNVSCGFCTRIHLPAKPMEQASVLSMMEAFARMGTRWWVFNGGEPTLVKELPAYVRQARLLGFDSTLVTNGTLLAGSLDALSALNLVICSIHGERDEHDRLVGRQGSWDAAVDALQRLRERGVGTCILTVLHERNREQLDAMLALGERIGAGVAFQPIAETRLGGARIDGTLVPRARAMASAVDHLVEAKMDGRPVSSSVAYLRSVAASWPDTPFGVKCWAGRLFCEVTPEGFVVPCCAEEEQVFAGCHGPTVGWERAFAALPDRSGCQGCWFKGPQELNLLVGLRPKHALRAVANLARGRLLWD
jgi:PqqA peptide cyclase